MKLLPRILPDEDEEDRRLDDPEVFANPEENNRLAWGWTAALAAAAAIPRLLYLFVFTDPENPGAYGDVWHHWQIAYLTKEIGLTAPGGPRLWDLKGLEYVWGLLHPILMVGLFDLTGSIDIVLNRLVSLICGVVGVVLLFHICRRHWGTQVAAGTALFAIFLPTSVMNDASGMLEPLGVMLGLFGIWAWPRRGGFWSGLAFGLATMARAEAWIFSLGLVIAAFLRRQGWQQRVPLVVAFTAVMLVQIKVLVDQTGNPIYPLYWNFFATALGKWQPAVVSSYQAGIRPVMGVLLVASAAGLVWTLWKRPPSYMLLLFGFGSWFFVAGMHGFTSFLSTWVWWTPLNRRFEFPYDFAAVLLVVALLWWAPRRFGKYVARIGWAALGLTLLASQLAWIPITQVFGPTEATWQSTLAESRQLGEWYNQAPYAGHALAVPADRPDITYGLARFGGVEGRHLVSEMYDPFAYLRSDYGYADHPQVVSTLVACWLRDTDTRMIAIPSGNSNYQLMLADNPGWFVHVGTLSAAGWEIVGVNAPRPSAADCESAKSASR